MHKLRKKQMKIILIILAIISITAFSIFKKKEIRYGSFDYPNIDVSDKKISEKSCVKFLEEVNNKFSITSGYEILVHITGLFLVTLFM